MDSIRLRDLFRNTAEYENKEVVVHGWVRNNRNSNKFGFIELNDGTFFKSVQVVYEEEFISNFEEISKAYVATALKVTGTVVPTPGAKQPFEIKATEIEIEGTSTPDYPLQPKKHEPDIKNVFRLCDTYNVPLATNLATAEMLIKSLDRGELEWREMYR